MPETDNTYVMQSKDTGCGEGKCRHNETSFSKIVTACVILLLLLVNVITLTRMHALEGRVSTLESKQEEQKQSQICSDAKENENDLSVNLFSRLKRNAPANEAKRETSRRKNSGRKRCRKDCQKLENSNEKQRCLARCKPTKGKSQQDIFGAHYVGKVERIRIKDKYSNGNLKSADGKFPYWQEADWMKNYKHKDKFELSEELDGVRVKRRGLYYIYAQMTFNNTSPDNTLKVSIKSSSSEGTTSLLRCSHRDVAIKTSTNIYTCFGAALQPLKENDIVYVEHFWINTNLMWSEERAYLGLIRLADFKF